MFHGHWIVGSEHSERPGEGFDDHVVAVVGQHFTDGKRPGGVAVAASDLGVEADRGDEGRCAATSDRKTWPSGARPGR